jgi:S-methylmethionine-dependent homocysteine/selenocysteine methylase
MLKKTNTLKHHLYLTDGGLETTMIFQQGVTLNHFAAFELLNNEAGKQALRKYYIPYLKLAARYGTGFILETPTWRANPDWATKLGYSADELKALNREAVDFVKRVAKEFGSEGNQILISGTIGPRGDGYKVGHVMTPEQSQSYHRLQVDAFISAGVNLIEAITMTCSEEAIGIVKAAELASTPVVISFTVETNGKLPSGEPLKDAIEKTDKSTGNCADYFMINCAHPEHFIHVLNDNGSWKRRIKGIRANASRKSHAELDESENLDAGDKKVLAQGYLQLRTLLPELKVVGGCCGTDHEHVAQICEALLSKQKVN